MSNTKPYSINNNLIQSLGLGTPYLHEEGTNRLIPTAFSALPVSRWIPAPASKLIPLLDGLSGYVALPVYLKKGPYGSKSTIADFQLAVTGSVAGSESPTQSSIREIQEEIGLETSTTSIVSSTTFTHWNRNIYASVHYPTTCTAAINPGTFHGLDDKSRKVITWILMNNPEEVFDRRRLDSADSAGKVIVVADVSDVRKLLAHFF